MNFPDKFLKWLRVCITTCMHSVKINGAIEGYFKASAGLRQGDPLSPYLFVIAMESLNLCIKRFTDNSNFSYHWRCTDLQLTHLIFTDDLLLFSKGDKDSIELLFKGVQLFSNISGLKANNAKSQCFFSNVDHDTKNFALSFTGLLEGSLPITYLGLPLISSKLNARDCQPLIDKLCNRVGSWTCNFISQGGRLQLVQAILSNIRAYWARHIFLPGVVVSNVQSILAKFLWSGSSSGRCIHKVAWKDCCYLKNEGGIGIINIAKWNEAAILFQIWRIINKVDSLWIHWLYAFELKRKGFWTMKIPYHCSWTWRRILNLREKAARFIRYSPGLDSQFLLWHDPWIQNRPLALHFDVTTGNFELFINMTLIIYVTMSICGIVI